MPHVNIPPAQVVAADEIRARRIALGYTLDDVAGLTGVTRQFVHLVEQGKRKGSLSFFIALAHALDCSVDDLVTGT